MRNKDVLEEVMIYVGGLGDDIKGGYIDDLMEFGDRENICVMAVKLRSMPYYGMGLIDEDVEDVRNVYAKYELWKCKRVYMVGHSTGAQVIMLCTVDEKFEMKNSVLILQGPVSDREYEEKVNKNLEKQLDLAEKIEEKILPFLHNSELITKQRFCDLFKKGGKEDFFSVGENTSHLNKNALPVYVIISTKDEYIAKPIDEIKNHLMKINGVQKIFEIEGTHSLKGKEKEFIGTIDLIIQAERKRGNV